MSHRNDSSRKHRKSRSIKNDQHYPTVSFDGAEVILFILLVCAVIRFLEYGARSRRGKLLLNAKCCAPLTSTVILSSCCRMFSDFPTHY